jgi:3-deoxy-D-manno-octulosonic-acid transferase
VRYFYTLLMICLTPFLLLRLWWKGFKVRAYRERIAERFSLKFPAKEAIDVWVHAVSLGEVIAITPLIEALLKQSYRVLMTTMTPTGSARVQAYFGKKVVHQYLPYDLPWIVGRFLKHYQPRIGITVETELWPNLIREARIQGIPLILINGRLSQQSYEGYRWLKGLFKPTLNELSAILVQTEEDKQRFVKLGADESRVRTVGNIKFDLNLEVPQSHEIERLKCQWGKERVVVILASTHENEEEQILNHLPRLQAAIPQALLLIAPRHPERFDKVYNLAQTMGYVTGRRTQLPTIHDSVEVVILDSLGELMQAYACSDYAFVGGSLVPVGGHNVLEPIAMGVPVFSGKLTHHFKAIIRTLCEAQAVQVVESGEALIEAIIGLHLNSEEKNKQIERASHILKINRGVIEHYLKEIEKWMGH